MNVSDFYMTACNIFVTGENFDVNAFLGESVWQKCATVYYRGEPTRGKESKRNYSGFSINISDPEEDMLEPQISDAIRFIQEHYAELERLANFSGIDEIELQIGLFWFPNTVCFPISLPPDILLLTGKLNIVVTISIYAA